MIRICIYAHPFGGSQDPCLLQLRDGTLLCTSYGWAFVREEGIPNLKKPYAEAGGAIFLGGYVLRSSDGGKAWNGPLYPPHITPEINLMPADRLCLHITGEHYMKPKMEGYYGLWQQVTHQTALQPIS